jgi:hypothetical protein
MAGDKSVYRSKSFLRSTTSVRKLISFKDHQMAQFITLVAHFLLSGLAIMLIGRQVLWVAHRKLICSQTECSSKIKKTFFDVSNTKGGTYRPAMQVRDRQQPPTSKTWLVRKKKKILFHFLTQTRPLNPVLQFCNPQKWITTLKSYVTIVTSGWERTGWMARLCAIVQTPKSLNLLNAKSWTPKC